MVNDKKKGSFFTPDGLSRFISGRMLSRRSLKGFVDILEPSVGHGAILRAINESPRAKSLQIRIDAIDNETSFVEYCRGIDFEYLDIQLKVCDFVDFDLNVKKYDAVIGNPPYVGYKILTKEQQKKCRRYFEICDVEGKYFKNLWTYFVLKSINCLKENGSIHFVIPKELLYVKHASWLRTLLNREFQRLNLFIFDRFLFDGLEQDVVIVECYRKHSKPGFFVCEKDKDLSKRVELKKIEIDEEISNKWSQVKVSKSDLRFIHGAGEKLLKISDYCTAVAGVVTAANKFFILSKTRIDEFGGDNVSRPIIQKSSYIKNDVIFDNGSLKKLDVNDTPCHLLNGFSIATPPSKIKKYLDVGEELELHKRYKMRQRNPWYCIPGLWDSPAFFFKRIHEVPKFVINRTNVLVTDTGYRVTPLLGYGLNSIVFSFYNSLTLVFAELQGRSYGGGVLELTPNEFKMLPVPYIPITDKAFAKFRSNFIEMEFAEFLKVQDTKILSESGLTQLEIANIQTVRQSLVSKRLKGKLKL